MRWRRRRRCGELIVERKRQFIVKQHRVRCLVP
jgi:hypothetical protein